MLHNSVVLVPVHYTHTVIQLYSVDQSLSSVGEPHRRHAALLVLLQHLPVGMHAQPALVIGPRYVTEHDSASVQYNGLL